MQDYLNNNSLEMKCAEHRHFILQIALKCADISNPCRPWEISRKWSYKVCDEFFRQGDYERRLNLPVTPLCDRHTTSIPKIQAGFFKHVVTPLYIEWHRFLGDGLSVSLMEYLKMNQKKWETLINQEAEEKKTDISELDEPEGVISSGEETAVDEDSASIELLIPPTVQTAQMPTLPGQVGLDRVGRRHSVPLSVSKTLQLPLNQNIRRESLPSEQVKTKDPLWKIENQSLFELSSLSLLSSKSNMTESPNVSVAERPISAENLLPDTSIASITSSTEASRLNTVLQLDNQNSVQAKQLTRQQTFPPLQSHVRTRYMSATVEMSQCYTQILKEADNSCSCSEDKSCSSGRYCSPSHDSNSCHKKKSNMSSVLSKELLMVDTPIKKQGLNLLDTTKQKYTLNSDRRHSIQTIRTDDSFSKHRYKRPSSAQDPDYTEMFYATLTGSHSDKNKCVPDMYISEYKSNLDCNTEFKCHGAKLTVQELQTTLSKKLDQHMSSDKSACSAQEPRRHSTPVTECRTITVDNAGRRYTTIPVSSELSTHKVFFIGSPPDSPPPNHSASSSSDSGSEPKRSIDDSNKETTVLIGNRKELVHVKEKNSKITKFNSDVQMKENVDPYTNDDFAKALSRRGNQVS